MMKNSNFKSIENDEAIKRITDNKLSIQDFSILKVIGKGSYGKVFLVKKNDDQKVYAMKVLKKKHMIKRNQVEHIKSERRILEIMDHQFLIKLKYSFQTPQKLYLIIDYCPGGELFYHIQRVERFNEQAQISIAISYLHENGIIYRDLKPENVLIDRDGYIKITDFGLSKQNIFDNFSANSFCGTPEYLAPEIIENYGHGKAVDWWSLGAITYEMLVGLPPFYSKDRDKLFKNIKTGNVKYPSYLSKDAINFMQLLFVRDPNQRLGSKNELEEIKAHPFLKNVDWDAIVKKRVKPPFIPNIKSDLDTKYIDSEFTGSSPTDSYEPDGSLDKNENPYKDFSYNKDEIMNN